MILENKFNLATFTRSDTAAKLHIDNTQMTDEQFNQLQKLYQLLVEVQSRISTKFGKLIPLQINSAFRCKALNKAVGGVLASQHCLGEAADTVAIGITREEYYQSLKMLAKTNIIVFGQVILEFGKHPEIENDDWIHISLPTKKHMNDFMRSPITQKDGARVEGKREYVKESL